MNPRTPPRLAVLLLKWFGLAHDEAFAGDLIEEFQSGRTAGWFWRQTFGAIGAVLRRGVRRPEVLPVIVGYGIATSATVLFLHIHGPIHSEVKSKILVTLIVAGGIAFDSRVQGRGKLGQIYGTTYGLVPANAALVWWGGDLCSPLWMLLVNMMWLAVDLCRALKRPMPAARQDSVGRLWAWRR